MKKVLLIIGGISIGVGLYMLYKGNMSSDHIALYVNGAVLIGMAFSKTEDKKCTSKEMTK